MEPVGPPAANQSTVRKQLPNALTCLRVVLAVAMVAVLSWMHAPGAALLITAAVLFVAAAVTDALDGMLARRWHVVSAFGRIMDPFADKLLVIGAFVCLAGPMFTVEGAGGGRYQSSGVASWMVVAILGRELLVTSIRAVFEGRGIDFSATWSGKWKMILQSIVVPAVLVLLAFGEASPGTWQRMAIVGMVWATVAVTLWSGVPYVVRAMKGARRDKA